MLIRYIVKQWFRISNCGFLCDLSILLCDSYYKAFAYFTYAVSLCWFSFLQIFLIDFVEIDTFYKINLNKMWNNCIFIQDFRHFEARKRLYWRFILGTAVVHGCYQLFSSKLMKMKWDAVILLLLMLSNALPSVRNDNLLYFFFLKIYFF